MTRAEKQHRPMRLVRSVFGRLGYEHKSALDNADRCAGLTEEERREYQAVAPFTMVVPSNVVQACNAVRYIVGRKIPGAIVECGVWRGGVVMAMLRALIAAGQTSRSIYAYDTFEGLPPPGPEDVSEYGWRDPSAIFAGQHQARGIGSTWCYAGLAEVKANVQSAGYPDDLLHFVAGKVEDTIPDTIPDRIALLRLDTDWYESTRHELVHLWPRLSPGGVLIIDDYGTWAGARKAVDEFFASQPVFIARGEAGVGYAVKPG
jgi:hypothetical protein